LFFERHIDSAPVALQECSGSPHRRAQRVLNCKDRGALWQVRGRCDVYWLLMPAGAACTGNTDATRPRAVMGEKGSSRLEDLNRSL